MSRRVVLGLQNDGTYGLRVSAPGIDAFTGDGQPGNFTFNSAWTDIAKIHMVGIGNTSAPDQFGRYLMSVSWPDLGYKPFLEVRRIAGNVVYDDAWVGNFPSGGYFGPSNAQRNGFIANSASGAQALYIIYAIPVASQ